MKEKVLLIISILVVAGVYMMPPIPQDVLYHQFADQQLLFGIANFNNVVSNLPFILIGIAGLRLISEGKNRMLLESSRFIYGVFFSGVVLVGAGSSWYHLNPDNSTLLWDRLAIAVTFMSFFAIVLGEFIHEKLALIFFPFLLFLGLASVVYWYWTESIFQGDLRLYLLVQFLPLLLMPIIFLSYRSRFTRVYLFWLVLGFYGLAKGCEVYDYELYRLTGVISGHTLKHLVSAMGALMLYLAICTRKARE